MKNILYITQKGELISDQALYELFRYFKVKKKSDINVIYERKNFDIRHLSRLIDIKKIDMVCACVEPALISKIVGSRGVDTVRPVFTYRRGMQRAFSHRLESVVGCMISNTIAVLRYLGLEVVTLVRR